MRFTKLARLAFFQSTYSFKSYVSQNWGVVRLGEKLSRATCKLSGRRLIIYPCSQFPIVFEGQILQNSVSVAIWGIQLKQSSLQEFSTIVEAIYDCALHPENWHQTTKLICSYVGGDAIALDFTDIRLQEPIAGYSFGFSKEYRDLLVRKYAHSWLLQSGFPTWKVGQPMRLQDIVPKNEFENGLFYRNWCQPQKQYDYTGMIALRDQTRFVKMTNSRLETRNAFTADDTERLRLLAPHICKSVSISDALNMTAVYGKVLETTLDQLKASVFLVNNGGQVSYMNTAATRLLDSNTSIYTKNGVLGSAGNRLEKALNDASKYNAMKDAHSSNGQQAIALPSDIGEGLVALVLPLQNGTRREFGLAAHASVAVFIREPHAPLDFAGGVFAELFGISPAELRVVNGLSQRLSLVEVSDTLGIGLPTVKTHLQHVFQKTDTSRQADLILLMSKSSPF